MSKEAKEFVANLSSTEKNKSKYSQNNSNMENIRNFITLTEIYLNNNAEVSSKVSIKPADIICMKDVKSEKHNIIKTSVFIANFSNPCQGFNFDGPILVKETREEIDKIITEFYKNKKNKPTG